MLKLYTNTSRGFQLEKHSNSSQFSAYMGQNRKFSVQTWKTLRPIWSLDELQDVRKTYFDEKTQMIGYSDNPKVKRNDYLMLIHLEIAENNIDNIELISWGSKIIRQTITREKGTIIVNIFAKLHIASGYVGLYCKKLNFVKAYFWDKPVNCQYINYSATLAQYIHVDVKQLNKFYRQKNEEMRQALCNSKYAKDSITLKLQALGLNISYHKYYFEYADRRYYYNNNSVKELKMLISQVDESMLLCGLKAG